MGERKTILCDDQQIHVVHLLRNIRLEAGLTQYEIATRLNKPQSFVSKYESGARQLNILRSEEQTSELP